MYQSLEFFCCILPTFLTKAVAVAKVIMTFSVNSFWMFFKNYLFDAHFEAILSFFSLNKVVTKINKPPKSGCLNYSL